MSGIEVASSLRKRPAKSSALHRVDVGEAGQVADDRADAGAAAAAGRQHGARRGRAAHLARDLAGQLQQLVVEEEEAGEVEAADRRQLLLEPGLGLAPARVAAVALAEAVAAEAGELAVGCSVVLARVAVAELGGEVEARGARRGGRSRRPPRGARRSAPPSPRGETSAELRLPRRRGSDSSSVSPRRTATRASWRWVRRRLWAWTLPVATAGDAEPLGEQRRASGCGRGRGASRAAAARPGSARGPKAASRRRPSRSPRAVSRRSQAPARAPSRAQPERQTSPSACSSTCSSVAQGGSALRAVLSARVRVRGGQQPAEVAIPVRVFDQQRHVRELDDPLDPLPHVDGPISIIGAFSAHQQLGGRR